ncbi:MAG: cyclase family protein [Rhodospirillales bacterium]|nr:cyclase family protein [Rhodospirillales bacterium]
MARRIVDLSVPLQNGVPADPPRNLVQIEYTDHDQSAPLVAGLFPGLAPADLPEGKGWAVEQVRLSTHTGTHVDAPWHYHPTAAGAPAPTIDALPLEWFFGPGVKLDFRHLPDGYVVGAAEIAAELARIGHVLTPGDIVVVNTAAGARYGAPDYMDRGCGMGREATLFLTGAGVRVVGTDGWSWDAPFRHTAARFAATGDAAIIWEGHKAGREAPYCQIEKLHNLEALPPTGFEIACFPVKLHRASAGWTRAVAIFTE